MAQQTLLSKEIKSLNDIKEVLKSLNRPNSDEVDKSTFTGILSGMSVIVECLQDDANAVDLNIAIQWLRLYMKVYTLVLSSEKKRKYFYKSVPITITYIIGWLQHAPSNEINFFTEILNITSKLVQMIDRNALKPLEKTGNGVLSLLWGVVDRVGHYNIQIQIMQFFILILKDLDKDFVFWEVKKIANVKSEEIIFKILELLMMSYDDDLFKKLSRSILNQFNMEKISEHKVNSFYCKSFEIGSSVKFLKPTYTDRFWFDINTNPSTLTFEGRVTPKLKRKYEDVNVSLKITEMYMDNNYLNIQFIPPVEISGIKFENKELFEADKARISLCKTELTRFLEAFNVPSKSFPSSLCETQTKPLLIRKKRDIFPKLIKKNPYMGLNLLESLKSNDKSNLRSNAADSPIPISAPFTENQKQIQQVKPLSLICEIDDSSKETKNYSTAFDEYENFDVSDAEPCQSYKNYSIRKPVACNFANSLPKVKTLKRSRKKTDTTLEHTTPCKISKEFNVWDYGPSTSKSTINIQMSGNTSISESAFDNLKDEIPSKKITNNHKIALPNDTSNWHSDVSVKSTIDLTMDFEETKIILSPKTPDRKNIVELTTSNSITKNVSTALVTYEHSQDILPYERKKRDCLVYHRRSDNESSSDDSDTEKYCTPKRKSYDLHKQSARKRLFRRSFSESDCEVMEFVYFARKDYHLNVQKMRTALSSFLRDKNSLPVIKKNRGNLNIIADIGDFYNYD